MPRLLLVLLLLCLVVSPARADELQRQDIPKNAIWCSHIDLDAFAKSAQLYGAMSDFVQSPSFQSNFPERLGFLKDAKWHGLTMYAARKGDVKVLLVRVETNTQELVELLREEDSYAQVQHGEHTIHHWLRDPDEDDGWLGNLMGQQPKSSEKKTSNLDPYYVCFAENNLVVITNRLSSLVTALDVVDGRVDRLADDALEQTTSPAPGTPIFQYHRLERFAEKANNSPTKPECLRLAVHGTDRLHVTTAWDMGSPQMVGMVMDMARPESLIAYLKTFLPPKDQQAAAEATPAPQPKVEEKPADDAKHGRFMVGAEFKGLDLDKDREEIIRYFKKSLKIEKDGRTIAAEWTGHVEAKFSYAVNDGIHDCSFKFLLLTDGQAAARTARRDDDK